MTAFAEFTHTFPRVPVDIERVIRHGYCPHQKPLNIFRMAKSSYCCGADYRYCIGVVNVDVKPVAKPVAAAGKSSRVPAAGRAPFRANRQ
jgi:hypothetical protein